MTDWTLFKILAKESIKPFRYYQESAAKHKWFAENGRKLRKFKSIHQGKDCFIIGNGPSLNKMDLTPLNDYYTFGLNKIYLIFEKVDLKLDFLVSVNDLVIQQSKERFEEMKDTPIFVSHEKSEGIEFQGEHIHRLDTSAQWSFYEDLSKPIAQGYTVTFVAMQVAFYMGFENVYLIGVDHNFQQKGKPNSKQKLDGDDQNHFHPDYFKGMDWHLADLEGSEASFAMAKQRYHRVGREIYDATLDGKLEVYKKIGFEEALQSARKK